MDPFAAFFRLGAECWGPRVADPVLKVKLASDDPARKEERIRLEEELTSKAIKRKERIALYRAVKRAKYMALVQSRREAKKKAAPKKTAPKKAAPMKKAAQKKKTFNLFFVIYLYLFNICDKNTMNLIYLKKNVRYLIQFLILVRQVWRGGVTSVAFNCHNGHVTLLPICRIGQNSFELHPNRGAGLVLSPVG